jgi:hypothetical protein
VHGLNIPAIVAVLSAKVVIRIESGAFVGRLGGEVHVLGPAGAGLAKAIQRMRQIRHDIQAGST